jgi:peptidyl-prolyl cis-trans isomerase D
MLGAIRTAASNWLGRAVLIVVMSLLVVSFAIWGIGDIFRGGVSRNVAVVGKENISADQFRTSFNEELRRVQQRARRAITTEDARAFGLDREILNRLIDESVMNQKATRLGLALDQQAIVKAVTEAEMFRVAGQFDRGRFAEILQQNGLNEAQFFRQQGDLMLRQQLAVGLVGGYRWPESFGRAVHQYREEARDLELILVPADKAAEPAAPTDEQLQAFHNERKSEFRTIETRKATVLTVTPTQFASSVTVSEADARAFYERALAQGRFGTPERRRAWRILFDTEAEAKAAAEKLAGGMTIEALLAEKKLTPVDVDLGMQTRAQITDRAVADAIFGLAENAISAPVKDPFGFVLLRLAGVEPARATPFEEVRNQITGEARLDAVSRDPAVRQQIDAAHRKVEDQRIAGKSLAEAAQIAGLVPAVIEKLDRQGGDGAGNRLSIAGGMDTVNAIFASDIGLDNEPLHPRDGSYIWFEVNAVDLARDKAFDEVKDEVRARYIDNEKSKAIADLATGLVKKLDEGATMAQIAGEVGAGLQIVGGVKRSTRDGALGQNGVDRAFADRLGKAVTAIAPDGVGRLIIRPTQASLLPYDPAADEQQGGIARQVAQGMSEDIVAQYVAGMRKEIGVSINQVLLNQALGQQPGR